MTRQDNREEWLRDAEMRQRNIVFPDTVRNEGQFWRNLSEQNLNLPAKAGLGLLGIFVAGVFFAFYLATYREGTAWALTWRIALGILLLFGPIFGVIAWATRRSLREIEQSRRDHGRSNSGPIEPE